MNLASLYRKVMTKMILNAVICFLLSMNSVGEGAPAHQGTENLVVVAIKDIFEDMPDDSVLRYDTLKLISALQGLVNRDHPRLFIRFLESREGGEIINIDDYWFEKIQRPMFPDRGILTFTRLDVLLQHFSSAIAGYVVWDPDVAASANVASTICGVEGWLPLRADSALMQYLQDHHIDINIKKDLCGLFTGRESGSTKCDAYLWAKREYLDTGKCNPALMAFYVDAYTQRPGQPGFQYPDLPNTTLANHDYYIARKAFFFDLLVWPDEYPIDDPNQPLGCDSDTLRQLLESQYKINAGKTFTCVGGFVHWNLKYTNHGPAGGGRLPVPTEWEYVAVFSAYNAFIDADALGLTCLPNASVYSHFPLRDHYSQQQKKPRPPLEEKTYVLIYMGDYDSAAWMSRHIPRIWDDPERGELPIAWAFNPNLSDRIPQAFDYLYSTATPNDYFIGGDSGAGYLNPNLLTGTRLNSGLPDAVGLWIEHNKRYYQKFDYSITGFVINGFHGDMPLSLQKAYAQFSPDGVGMQLGFEKKLVGETPFIRHHADIYPKAGNTAQAAEQMASFAKASKPEFLVFRWILQTPSMMKKVYHDLLEGHGEHDWVFCDPYTFFALYREKLERDADPFNCARCGVAPGAACMVEQRDLSSIILGR